MKHYLSGIWAATLAAVACTTTWAEETGHQKPPQIIVLKFDGLKADAPKGAAVSERWTRLTDYLTKNNIHAGYGIVCSSLEKDNPAYFDWIKSLHAKGLIEFWLHGFRDRSDKDKIGEFETGTADQQKSILEKSEKLAQDKLGFEFDAFGPHWSATTVATEQALNNVPEIKIWLGRPNNAKQFTKFGIPRIMALENPTFITDVEMFLRAYDSVGGKQEMLMLQGHPDRWNEVRWKGFLRMMDFLKSKGCVFMTPTEYMDAATGITYMPLTKFRDDAQNSKLGELPQGASPLPSIQLHPPQQLPPLRLPPPVTSPAQPASGQ